MGFFGIEGVCMCDEVENFFFIAFDVKNSSFFNEKIPIKFTKSKQTFKVT